MPKGKPRLGYRRTKKLDAPSIEEIERRLVLRVPELISALEELSKPLQCPSCGTVVKQVDRDAIIYLIDRAMGKPTQRTELDITQTITLTADQVDLLIERYQIANRALLPAIDGEAVKVL